MTRYIIDHKLPTSEEMRAEVQRKLDAGERLGANHVAEYGPIEARIMMWLDDYHRNPHRVSIVTPGSPTGRSAFSLSDPQRWMNCPAARPRNEGGKT